MLSKPFLYMVRHNLEAYIWLFALIFLAFQDPGNIHFSLCPLKNAGWNFCPGCGLGRSVSFLFRGEISNSIQCHPLGVFAVAMIISRIVQVFRNTKISYKVIYK